MSSHDSMGIVFSCLSKGAVDFLVKPIRKNELKNLWQHVWRRCHSVSCGYLCTGSLYWYFDIDVIAMHFWIWPSSTMLLHIKIQLVFLIKLTLLQKYHGIILIMCSHHLALFGENASLLQHFLHNFSWLILTFNAIST